MKAEGQQIKYDKQSREVLFAMAETVLKVVTTGFQNVERLVLYLPACAATHGEFGDVLPGYRQVGDEAVPVSELAGRVNDLNFQPVDRQGILGVTQRNPGDSAIPMGGPGPAAFDALGETRQRDTGDVFLNKGMRGGLADEQEVAAGGLHRLA